MKMVVIVLVCCLSTLLAEKISVAAAANVTYAIKELNAAFEKQYPQHKVEVTLGSSGKLTAQIKHGAPYDLFLSANMKYPEALYQEKLAVTNPKVYALGTLALFSRKKSELGKNLKFLDDPDIRKVAIANPKTAPYGKAALEALEKSGVYRGVKKKLVYAESITQTLQFVLSAADIGFIAKSALYSDKLENYTKGVNWEDVDTALYTPIKQGVVVLKHASQNKAAYAYKSFLESKKAQHILMQYGYLLP